jgi:NAD(P)H-hydrate epimerase
VILLDALLGTGFSGELREPVLSAIKAINAAKLSDPARVHVIAVDIPSGLNGDVGPVGTDAVRADVTLTLAAPKKALELGVSAPYTGTIKVIDIGIPNELLAPPRRPGRT